ncbi:MAG TPA: FAD-binding oxidoreductase [Pseudolabrys sp.]|jgi:glycine/D-amino acid oxidase-like deaminating enzyme|nr:FAD-binding oxidoreductase [Pseudolabrys sp.]
MRLDAAEASQSHAAPAAPELPPESWYEATRIAAPERRRLNYDLDVDVCVIGAGFAGLTAAREIARRGWSVAVLEANRVAWAASGRNTGFVLPGFADEVDSMVDRIGLDHTKQLWALSERGLAYVRETITETNMPGVDPFPGWLLISKKDDKRELPDLVERMRWIGANVEAWSPDRVRAVLPSRYYFNAIHYPTAFHIHPLNYALGLAAAAEAAGARIFENSPAVSIDPAGVRKRIVTQAGRVRAAHVVLAGNVHLKELVPRLAATLLPITTYVMVTEPIPNLHDVIGYRGAVSDGERANNHYRIVGGDRLQWSGRMTVWEANPRWFARGLVSDIKRNFPALEHVKPAYIWHGTLGRSVHRMPQIGEVMPGVWVASGFGGHGLNTTAMGGELVARGIVERDQTWRLFAPYELVWAGGTLGRVAAQGIYFGRQTIDRAEQGLARYREQARRRKQARQAVRRVKAGLQSAESPPAGAEPIAKTPMAPAPDFGASPEPVGVIETAADKPEPPTPKNKFGKRKKAPPTPSEPEEA